MKNMIAASLLVLLPFFAQADVLWTCTVTGEQNFGDPAGPIYQTVWGQGATEMDALNTAQNNCFSEGLQMCQLQDCSQEQN